MVKVTSERLLPPDDPMFSGGLETFYSSTSSSSFTISPRAKAEAHPANLPETEEDGILAEGLRRLRMRRMAQQGQRNQTED